jgi:trigger factor
MNVTFNQSDELNGTITVSLSSEDFADNYQKKLKEFAKLVNIPGFRVGHAPKKLIEKMYGKSILLEEIKKAASSGLFDYIEENKLNILGEPTISKETVISDLKPDGEYTFAFEIGLAPEFELNISKEDVFTKYVVDITDAMIDEEVSRICKKFGTLADADTVSENDTVYFNLTELNNGEVLEGGVTASNVPVAVNNIKDEALRAQITGAKKGAELIFNIFTLFNNNESEISHALGVQKAGVADLGPDFKAVIADIKTSKPADVNQTLFDKVYGEGNVTDEADFRNKIKEELVSYFNSLSMHFLKLELFDKLVEKHNIPLPEAFLKRWLLKSYPDKFNKDNIDEKFIPEAKYLRNHIFEEKILAANNIKIGDDEIKEAAVNYTKNMFGIYGPATGINDDLINSIVEPQLEKEDFRSRMINLAVRKSVNDYIYNNVTLEEKLVSESEFMDIVQEHNSKHQRIS